MRCVRRPQTYILNLRGLPEQVSLPDPIWTGTHGMTSGRNLIALYRGEQRERRCYMMYLKDWKTHKEEITLYLLTFLLKGLRPGYCVECEQSNTHLLLCSKFKP